MINRRDIRRGPQPFTGSKRQPGRETKKETDKTGNWQRLMRERQRTGASWLFAVRSVSRKKAELAFRCLAGVSAGIRKDRGEGVVELSRAAACKRQLPAMAP